jgi:hypothetical protein
LAQVGHLAKTASGPAMKALAAPLPSIKPMPNSST